jgi:protein-export membrane protein SecD
MRPLFKNLIFLVFILLLAAGSAWIVWPHGSRINLTANDGPLHQTFSTHLGLDLQGGSHLVYQADFKDIPQEQRREALTSARDTIERRVNSFGVSEPLVQIEGQDKILVELPGIKNVDDAIKQIGQTPFVEFKLKDKNATPTAHVDANGQATINTDSLYTPTGLSGKHLKRATADYQSQGTGKSLNNEVVVRLEFNDEGRKLFADITTKNVGNQLAMFLDGQVLSEPVIQTPITDGVAVVTGNFTVQEAQALATRLNSGALPVPIKLVSQQNVGATLGQESIHKSIIAGLIGLMLIALFMIFYYRLPGVMAIFALAIYALLSFAIFKIGISSVAVILVGIFFFMSLTLNSWFGVLALASYLLLLLLRGLSPVTLTLAGIAGFILSIGMAVDANILIFERFKEEARSGKALGKALEDGFDRAWLSIRDSNISSLITTAILYMFGTPAIKGFAITLGVGILISMFTAITISRTFLRLVVASSWLTKYPRLFGVGKKAAPEKVNSLS